MSCRDVTCVDVHPIGVSTKMSVSDPRSHLKGPVTILQAGKSPHQCHRPAWAMVIAVATVGLMIQSRVAAGIFRFGGDSGRIAKLQFRLKESFSPTSVAWSPDGRYIATGSTMDARVDIWDVARRKIIKVLRRRYSSASFHDITWSPDNRYLAFCDAGGVARVYDIRNWSEAHVFAGPRAYASCMQLAFSGDSRQLAMLGIRYLGVFSVTDWSTIKSTQLGIGRDFWALLKGVEYMPNSHIVMVAGAQYVNFMHDGKKQARTEGRVWFLNPSGGAPSRSIVPYPATGTQRGDEGEVRSLTVSPDGRNIVTGVNTGAGDAVTGIVNQSVHILRSSDGQLIAAPLDGLRPDKFTGGLANAYTHDSRYIIVPHDGEDGWIHVLDGRTFKVIDLIRSGQFNYDISVNEVNDDFAVGTNTEVIVWSLPGQ